MRRLILLMLCLALPLQGWAGLRSAELPCSMEEMVAAQPAEGTVSALPECCNDAETAALTGQLCKSGQECQVPTHWVAGAAAALAQAAPGFAPIARLAPPPPPGALTLVWRPPAQH